MELSKAPKAIGKVLVGVAKILINAYIEDKGGKPFFEDPFGSNKKKAKR